MDTKETLLAWAAGLLDADGTLTIKRQKRYGKWYYTAMMQLSQVDTEKGRNNTAKLKQVLGGHVRKAIVKKGGVNKIDKEIIVWQSTSKNAAENIASIIQFMAGKKRQAETLKDFCEECFSKKEAFRLTDEDMEKRRYYFEKMRSLQEKGFNPSNND